MIFNIEERLSGSPFIEKIWRMQSESISGKADLKLVETKPFGSRVVGLLYQPV